MSFLIFAVSAADDAIGRPIALDLLHSGTVARSIGRLEAFGDYAVQR
jgi:hypothetical protein